MKIKQSYDTSLFIEQSIFEVYKTLFIAFFLVILVIYLFLGNTRTTLIPAATIPVSIMGTFIVLYAAGFTINILSLLALVLAIGLLVDDAIVVIENISRRIDGGEKPLLAAFNGARQVGFAVIATTVILVASFIPITFVEGDVGRLFSEFAVTISSTLIFSSFAALTLAPMLSSKLLKKRKKKKFFTQWMDTHFDQLKKSYEKRLTQILNHPKGIIGLMTCFLGAIIVLWNMIPREFTPKEDRGAFFMFMKGPEGASYDYTLEHIPQVEKRLKPFVDDGSFQRLLIRAPGSFGTTSSFNDAIGIVVLSPWSSGRESIWHYVSEVRKRTQDIPGLLVFPVVRQGLGGRTQKPVQFVLGGPTFKDLLGWRDILLEEARKNKQLVGLDHDYKETKPQLSIRVDRQRAGDLGISFEAINQTLETLLGSKRATTFVEDGEEYDVILEAEKRQKATPLDMRKFYVRSEMSGDLIPLSNLISITEYADVRSRNRYNRLPSITFEANLAPGYTVGEALTSLESIVKEKLPENAFINYKGLSLDFKESEQSLSFIFALALLLVFLVLAGQFESFIHPFVILGAVPLALFGGLLGLWLAGQSINIYSQIGLITLMGIAAKNGILIVEFINQHRDEGMSFKKAIINGSSKRLRPIIMTGVTTAFGAVPLILSHGAGEETRYLIGIVIFSGLIISVGLTLFVIPTLYALMAKKTTSPKKVSAELERLRGGK